ncbi:MAG: hypothetical protein VKJ64_05105 [Leptolyngbyaceae bacterium]|nr:hypothetical protein [Leptolyngbyaceae bacterium]
MATQQQECTQQIATGDYLVTNLKVEKQTLINPIRQAGYELGLRTASSLSHEDFHHLEQVRPLAAAFDEDVLKYLWSYLEAKGCSKETCACDQDCAQLLAVRAESRVLFCQSWLDGVLHVWDLIKAQMEQNA